MVNTQNRVMPDLSRTYTPASGSGTVTDVSNLPYTLGTVVQNENGSKRYKFVLVEDLALVVGNLVSYTTDDNGYEVSPTNGAGACDITQPAGLAIVIVADGDCGWIQTYGLNDVAMVGDGSIAAGESIMPHATTDGGVDTWATNPSVKAGQSLIDDAPGLAIGGVFLDCPKG